MNRLQTDFSNNPFSQATQRELLEDPFNGTEISEIQFSLGGDRPNATQANLLEDPFSKAQLDPLGGCFPITPMDRSDDPVIPMPQGSWDDLDNNRQQALLVDPLQEICRWIPSD